MTDIVERLRTSVTKGHEPTDEDAIEAADEIERLRADLHSPVKRRRIKGDRFGISINWDDYSINGTQRDINQVWRLIWMVKQLEKSHPDLYAHMSKIAAEMERLCDRDQRYTADDLDHLRKEFPDLFTKVVGDD